MPERTSPQSGNALPGRPAARASTVLLTALGGLRATVCDLAQAPAAALVEGGLMESVLAALRLAPVTPGRDEHLVTRREQPLC